MKIVNDFCHISPEGQIEMDRCQTAQG